MLENNYALFIFYYYNKCSYIKIFYILNILLYIFYIKYIINKFALY